MKPIDLFMQFFRREGWIYAISLTMLIAIDVAFYLYLNLSAMP